MSDDAISSLLKEDRRFEPPADRWIERNADASGRNGSDHVEIEQD